MQKGLKMIAQIMLLYIIYLIGSWVQYIFALPIPGSIIGMVLLFILLLSGGIKLTWIQDGAGWMMDHLVLFIIPATVGVMGYFSLFAGKGFLLIPIVLISTVLVIITSGATSQWLMRRKGLNRE